MSNKKILLSSLLFLFLCFMIGFSLGTFVLSIIIENYVPVLKQMNVTQQHENLIVICIILVYLFITFLLTFYLYKKLHNTRHSFLRIMILLIMAIITAYCLFYWFTPNQPLTIYAETVDGRFVFGPYPKDKAALETLKKRGITTIISLMNPAIIPFEPVLINKEKNAAAAVKLKFINIPMIPWISQNDEAISKIDQLAKSKDSDKYYVHCYYGQDRVRIFEHMVNKYDPLKTKTSTSLSAKQSEKLHFSRGYAFWLDKDILLSPMPSIDTEILFLVDNFTISNIVSLQNLKGVDIGYDPIKANLNILEKKYNVNFINIPINPYPYDPDQVLSAVNKIHSLRKPVLVYDFYMPPQSIVAEGFLLSYLTNLPSLPSQLFATPLKNGSTEIIAPNVALGPTPTPDEFSLLQKKGIRTIGYFGDCKAKKYKNDMNAAQSAKLKWQCFNDDDQKSYLDALAKNGPWYVYGPDLQEVKEILIKNLGQALEQIKKKYLHPT